jgi:hypothetical protein
MKNETSFRLTGVRRNSLFERTTPSANFRRRKNSSLTSFARPYRGRTTDRYAVRSLRSLTQIPPSAELRVSAMPLSEIGGKNQIIITKGDAHVSMAN